MDVHKLIQFFSDLIYILLYVTLSVKVLKKSMASSLAGSNRGMMVRSSPNLFWNGVPDRIICLLVRISANAELCTKKRVILSGTPFQNNFGELRTIMRLLLSPNDEDMVLLNPLTLYKRDMRGVEGRELA